MANRYRVILGWMICWASAAGCAARQDQPQAPTASDAPNASDDARASSGDSAPESVDSLAGIWVSPPNSVPFSFLFLERVSSANGRSEWCATTDGGALGTRSAEVDENTFNVSVRFSHAEDPGSAAPRADSQCPRVYPPLSQGDGVMPSIGPDVLRCTPRQGTLECTANRGVAGTIVLTNVTAQLDAVLRVSFGETAPNASWDGGLTCSTCPADLASYGLEVLGPRMGVGAGESLIHVRGPKGRVLAALAANPDARFEVGALHSPEDQLD